jgi:hypothetical protein
MVERRACAILRLVSGDPFATAPAMPYRAPKSVSITDRFRFGTSVGGDPLDLSLAGVMGLWVAASGGGKTGILQALAESTTACRDNITIDLDPHGDGLEDLYDAVRITARTHEQIEAVLLFFLMSCRRRRAPPAGSSAWARSGASARAPARHDLHRRVSEAVRPRQEAGLRPAARRPQGGSSTEIASQGGTKLYLGQNIAQMIALKGRPLQGRRHPGRLR